MELTIKLAFQNVQKLSKMCKIRNMWVIRNSDPGQKNVPVRTKDDENW